MGDHENNKSKTIPLLVLGLLLLLLFVGHLFQGCGTEHTHHAVQDIQQKSESRAAYHNPRRSQVIDTPHAESAPSFPAEVVSVIPPSVPSVQIQTPEERWVADNDGTPSFVVSLTEADSSRFFDRYQSGRISTRSTVQNGQTELIQSFFLSNSNQAITLNCSKTTRNAEIASIRCSFRFHTTRTNNQTEVRYNSAQGRIQLVLTEPTDIVLFRGAFVGISPILSTAEELVLPATTGGTETPSSPRARIDCETRPDSCVIEAVRDFQNIGDIH